MGTVREAAFELLRRHGMTTMFGNPGSNELRFLRDFPADFRYVLGLHEGAVMAMADGFAQATGRAPLVNLHSAAGVGGSMGVLANTVVSKSPVVVLAGQQVRDTVGQEVMVSNVDAAQLPRPLSKWSTEPLSPNDVIRSLAQGIHTANLPPRGPVHISVPYDDWDHAVDENAALTLERVIVPATELADEAVQRLASLIDGASRVALVLGPDVDARGANADAVRLAERLAAEVWLAPTPSRCSFPTTHPQFQGVLPANVEGTQRALEQNDLVLVFGAPVFRYHHHHPGRYLSEGSQLVMITEDAAEAARAPFGDAVVAPVKGALERLAEAVRARSGDVRPRSGKVPGEDLGGRLHPDTVYRTISDLAPDDSIHVNESTSTAESFWANVVMTEPGSFYSPAAGGLGFGLPAAVGVQLAVPHRQVVATIGDGSANFGIVGLWSAARYRVPVVFVILRNETYGALVNFSKRLEVSAVPGFDLPGIDFVSIARGYGVAAESVSTEAALRAALERALQTDEPALIEVLT